MHPLLRRAAASGLALVAPALHAQTATGGDVDADSRLPVKTLGVVIVNGTQPSSLPTTIPTTTESITHEQIERTVNATDSEDALKYFPSLLVRKRYIGDYNHAVLSSRASGTGNSARSAVYADGILLSNYLGNGVGGLTFAPRWNLVTPEEIERVDVMYGPFSAAYPGNSVGAVVDFVTRMPTQFEAHAKAGDTFQSFDLYGTHDRFRAYEASASIGDKVGAFSWWIDVNRTDSQGQPLTFSTRLLSSGVHSDQGVPVTGAVIASNNAGAPWFILGSATQYDTEQDHLKVKVAYDLTPEIRANYLFAIWQNRSENSSLSYLRDASGNAVTQGPININGIAYTGTQSLSGGDFALTRESLLHTMQGLSLKQHTQGVFDWEVASSVYDYGRDQKRENAAANSQPQAWDGGAGTIADGSGTGWTSLALKTTWRPLGIEGEHVVDFGAQQDRYSLDYITSNIAVDWIDGPAGTLASAVGGRTRLQSLWGQDAWHFAPDWMAVLGLRLERWRAYDGRTEFSATTAQTYASRTQDDGSPKAALSWQWQPDTTLKVSVGRAVRFPTVSELYGATSTTNSQYINDPNLEPERSWTGELSAESTFDRATTRLTLFGETTRDSLYSQTVYDPVANRNISRVQNVGHIVTKGVETAFTTAGLFLSPLDLLGSITYADSTIVSNDGFVAVPGDTKDKRQPNIPRWRATALASWRFDETWTGTVAGRYSGKQYRTLNNADTNGVAYMGVSRYATVDLRLVGKLDRNWTVAFGIDNANDYQYWNFHPYPQRTYTVELRYDL